MVTVLRSILPKSSGLLCVFGGGGQKDSVQRKFIMKCLLFTLENIYRVKRFITGSSNSLKDVQKSQMMSDKVRKSAETTVKRLLCCGVSMHW
jgi:hypothetical protein